MFYVAGWEEAYAILYCGRILFHFQRQRKFLLGMLSWADNFLLLESGICCPILFWPRVSCERSAVKLIPLYVS